MKFVLATGNKGKIAEMQAVLGALGISVITQADAGADLDVPETGATFYENALIKARAISEATGMPAIADDSGLMVDALGGAPGVYSKRYGGGNLDDAGLCSYLLSELAGAEQRGAKFVSSIVCFFPDGGIVTATGECPGEILHAPRGTGGFGYDPVFLVSGTGQSMAEMTQDEKNAVSHRGEALRAFAIELNAYLNNEGRI